MSALKNSRSMIFVSTIRKIIQSLIVVLLFVSCINLQAQSISELEYFFGNDPGTGNGTLITATTNSGDLTQSVAIPLTGLASGFHTLTFRAKDDSNSWSLYHRKTFYIIGEDINDAPSNLAAVEYWFGADPGNGNGTAIALSATPSETIEDFAIPLGTLDAGFHTLSIRIKNVDDVWSLYHRKTFYIISPATYDSPSPLTDAEFLYDAELGFGTGTAVAITPTGNPDEYLVEIPTDIVDCGFHDISLSVKNTLGNYSLYDITVDTDVYDNVPPTIVVFPNIIVELDANGQAVPFTISDVDNGTFDDCELTSVVLNQAQFDYTCADLGTNTVTVTATDAENKVSTLNVTVTVVDTINPVAITQNITVQLDTNGNATTTADAIDNNSTDNCSITSKNLDVSNFTCANLGVNTVLLTVTDQSGNQNTANAIVTVEDNVNPVAITQNITVELDTNGNASTTADAIDNNSTDNCSITNKSLDVSSFTCADLGVNTVLLTVTDQSGNQHAANAIVTVEDNLNPVAITQNITVQLDTNGNATTTADAIDNNSTDNCSITSKNLDVSNFNCANLGVNTVLLTVTDQSGNQHTANAIVTVEDNVNPVAIGQDITIDLAGNSSISIVASDVDNSSNDNCGAVTLSIDVDTFTAIGDYSVVLTATDGSGNTHNITVIVTVDDSTISVEEFNVDSFKIFPNPTANILHVNFEHEGDYSFTVYDISGKEIFQQKTVQQINTFDFSKYAAGIYILRIKDKKTSKAQHVKIIKS